jgi:glyoxylase-like metal-dependent hydrolase (beta-lactamase superfamily II)
VLRLTIVSPALGANCYVLAADDADGCVIVDPGYLVSDDVNEAVAQHNLTPEAILISHGHVDHTASGPALAVKYDIPVYIHQADAPQLDDPLAGLPSDLSQMLNPLAEGWHAPPDVRHIGGATSQPNLAGLDITAIHAPGHTEGSTLYHVPEADLLFTGDVLFAGTIGRTDLPGGDNRQMADTLRFLSTPPDRGGLPGHTVVLAGHGEATELGRERATNPYLNPSR